MHIGSGIESAEPYRNAVRVLIEIADELGIREGLSYIDIGGGFGVPYREKDPGIDIEKVGDVVRDALDSDLEVRLEPGRYLIAQSTILLTRVNTRKKDIVGVDAGLHTLARPMIYNSYHHITNI